MPCKGETGSIDRPRLCGQAFRHTRQSRKSPIRFLAGLLLAVFLSGPDVYAEPPSPSPALAESRQLLQQTRNLIEAGKYAQAVPTSQKALELNEQALGQTHVDVAEALNLLGLAYHYMGKAQEARSSHERALAIRERAFGKAHPLVAESLTNLARAYVTTGQYSDAQGFLERALTIREQSGMPDSDTAITLTQLGMVRGLLMDLPGAIRDESRAVDIFEKAPNAKPADVAQALNSLGTITGRTGDFAKARPLMDRALRLQEEALGPTHPAVARTLDSLADLSSKTGAWEDALAFAERALHIREQAYGTDHVEVAASLNTLGRLHWYRKDLAKASSLIERALQTTEKAVGANHPVVAANLLDLGEIRRQQGQIGEARKLFARAIQIQERSLGDVHPDLATSFARVASLNAQSGDIVGAIREMTRATTIREHSLGPQHPDLAVGFNDLAQLHHASGDLAKARPLYERARQIYGGMSQLNEDLDDATLAKVAKRGIAGLQNYALLLATLATDPKQADRTAVADGFLVAEQARGWIVQAAVAKAMARRQAGTSEEMKLTQRVDELRRKRQSLRSSLAGAYGQTSDQGDTARGELHRQLEQVQRELEQQIARLETTFPRYASVAFPKPADMTSVQSVLRPGEALISFYALDDRVQMWLLQADRDPVYREAMISRSKLARLATQFRQSLTPPVGSRVLPPVDVDSAFELYRLLFGPFKTALAGAQTIFIVPDELLVPVPFAALLTDKNTVQYLRLSDVARKGRPIPFDELDNYPYASLPWLGKSQAIAVLPSAGSLRFLREKAASRSEPADSFLGFGDPVFDGTGTQRGTPMLANRGGSVERDRLRQLNRLPGTREEVLTMAKLFGVNADTHTYLDQRATEAMVKTLNRSGQLGRTQVLAFSTHGLLAGDLLGLSQPALALTVPDIPSEEDDGLLTLEEVLELKLRQTELVVLSACNTAGGDGSGESLSGLARAFFFAGAKALLVSYWSVDDAATQRLMTETFSHYAKDRQGSPAEALRQGMLGVMGKTAGPEQKYFTHPYAWASFMVVGAGR